MSNTNPNSKTKDEIGGEQDIPDWRFVTLYTDLQRSLLENGHDVYPLHFDPEEC